MITRLQLSNTETVTTFKVSATDTGGGALIYEWAMEGEACGTPRVPWKQTGATVSWSHSNQPPDSCTHNTGDHQVVTTLRVKDARGGITECQGRGTSTQDIANPPCNVVATPIAATTPASGFSVTSGGPAAPVGPLFEPPLTDGANMVTWPGGTIAELDRKMSASGAKSAVVQVNGQFEYYIPGTSIVVVNELFLKAFPNGIPAGTVIWVSK